MVLVEVTEVLVVVTVMVEVEVMLVEVVVLTFFTPEQDCAGGASLCHNHMDPVGGSEVLIQPQFVCSCVGTQDRSTCMRTPREKCAIKPNCAHNN